MTGNNCLAFSEINTQNPSYKNLIKRKEEPKMREKFNDMTDAAKFHAFCAILEA